MAYQRPRRITKNEHEWTTFEKHTLLCLMAKGTHLEERGKRSDEPGSMRRHAYLNVATELNLAVNGKNGYGNDIDKRDVAKMIDKMLQEKKGVVGQGGYMERATSGRITRGLRMMWEREPSFDYDGSVSEWKQWRKESEEEKKRVKEGGVPKESVVILPSIENDPAGQEETWPQADVTSSNHSAPVDDRNKAPRAAPIVKRPSMPATNNHNSFNRLPARIRGNNKFSWADPERSSSLNHSSCSGAPGIDSYRPSGCRSSLSSSDQHSQSSTRYEQMPDSYHPLARSERGDNTFHPFSSSYHFSDNQSRSITRNEQFDLHSDNLASMPSLVPDNSSSPTKGSAYSGTARLSASRPSTTTSNLYEDAHFARSIQYEMAQKSSQPTSSEYKKPGISKRRPTLNDSGRGDQTSCDGINPARRAMLAEDRDVEMSEERMEKVRRAVGKGANKEDSPFSHLDNMRDGSDGSDVDMDRGYY